MALRRMWAIGSVALAFACIGATNHGWAAAAGMAMKIATSLRGSEQVPAVQTKGKGQFQGTIAANNKSISYRLTFSGLSSSVTAASVVAGGGIKRGDLAGLIKVITAGDTYVNVHTTKYKDGEVRGQIAAGM